MAWFGEGLSTLKGQLQNFTKEVLSEGKDDSEDSNTKYEEKIAEYEELCKSQQLEISELREQNAELRRQFNATSALQGQQPTEDVLSTGWTVVDHRTEPEITGSNRDLESVSNGTPKSSEEMEDLKRQLESLEQQVARLQVEKERVLGACERTQEENDSLLLQNEEINKKYQELSNIHESLRLMVKDKNANEQKQQELMQDQLTELQLEKTEALKTCEQLQQQIKSLTLKNEEILKKYEEQSKMYESLRNTIEDKDHDEKTQLESLQHQLAELQQEKMQAVHTCKRLEEGNEDLARQNEEIQQKYQEHTKLLESMKSGIEEKENEKSQLESLKGRLAELQKENTEAVGARRSLEEQISTLISQNEDISKKYQELSMMHESLKQIMEEKEHAEKTHFEHLQGQVTGLQEEKLQAVSQCKLLEEHIATLTSQNEETWKKYQEQLKMYELMKQKLEVSSQTEEKEALNRKTQLESLQDQLSQLQNKYLEGEENICRLRDQMRLMKDAHAEEINELHKQLKTSSSAEDKLKGHVKELETQLTQAQEQLLQTLSKSEKTEHERKVKRLEKDDHRASADILGIVHKLEDTELQEMIHGHITALEMENHVLKLRNAQLEKEGTAIRNNVNDMDRNVSDKFTSTDMERKEFVEASTNTDEIVAEPARPVDEMKLSAEKIQEIENQIQERYNRDHERLRLHLVSIEEYYTAEALKSEAQLRDLQAKLAQAEELLKQSSTAYTSASIRTNQQVEALEKQVKLTLMQKEESQQKLIASEEKINRQAVALQNLQSVLEQFQKGKDLEIAEEVRKVNIRVNIEKQKQEQLSKEITCLKDQLAEAKAGLTAASRLHEALDEKTKRISGLQEEVSKLTTKLVSCEDKLKTASVKLEGLIEKNLIKNLIMGYFMAPSAHRPKALHVVATVLDLNREERERIGLDGTGPGGGGWLNKLLYPSGTSDSGNTQSLSEAFVRFLEKESMPQPNLRLLPDEQRAVEKSGSPTPSSTRSSRRPSVHTAEFLLPTFMPEPDGSTSILDSILNKP